jgi:hypothetical protein
MFETLARVRTAISTLMPHGQHEEDAWPQDRSHRHEKYHCGAVAKTFRFAVS